jgi:hypothetical protein
MALDPSPTEAWLGHLERLRQELPAEATLHIGHGGPATPAHLERQRAYIETFVGAVRSADWSQPEIARAAVVERMTRLLLTDELQFVMKLSIDPVAARLGIGAIRLTGDDPARSGAQRANTLS